MGQNESEWKQSLMRGLVEVNAFEALPRGMWQTTVDGDRLLFTPGRAITWRNFTSADQELLAGLENLRRAILAKAVSEPDPRSIRSTMRLPGTGATEWDPKRRAEYLRYLSQLAASDQDVELLELLRKLQDVAPRFTEPLERARAALHRQVFPGREKRKR